MRGAIQPDANIKTGAAFAPIAAKMQAQGLPDVAVRIFENYYGQLRAGATGFIAGTEAGAVKAVPDYATLPAENVTESVAARRGVLDRTVVLKLNGGLGTSMGMTGPKSLLPLKDNLTFLDIILRQMEHLRATTGARLPLVLMNSFSTQAATQAVLDARNWEQDIPATFLQHMLPKIRVDTLEPVTWPDDPQKEWCPPGHGDIYAALSSSGVLQAMHAQGYEYLFVSNSDNLGAILDERILGHMARTGAPFLMEVAARTAADRKGGHLAQNPQGGLLLRELSQCPPDELDQFQDIARYGYFNTNNLWIHLPALQALLDANQGLLPLPLICNEKPVDPTQPASPRVYQLETAMGAAIARFDGAQALCVPRTRFAPVKKNSDLLVLWSDAYRLSPDYRLTLVNGCAAPPLANLDDRFYQQIADLQQRFPHGAPSLARCRSLTIEGDIYFGREIVVEGDVLLQNPNEQPVHIPDGTHLTPTSAI
ncbi:MAG: UTP--glucose-1-phosphate uridylyltransferase [Litorilinea sp.]